MRTRWISTLLLGCLLPGLLGRPAIAADPAKDDITAIEFLGETDSASHPESQAILIDHLLKDPREAVRFAAVKAITCHPHPNPHPPYPGGGQGDRLVPVAAEPPRVGGGNRGPHHPLLELEQVRVRVS